MTCQSCLPSSLNSLLVFELCVLFCFFKTCWMVDDMLGFGLLRRAKPGASMSLVCYIRWDSRRLGERQYGLIWLDKLLSNYVCSSGPTQPDIHRWAFTSTLTPGPASGERMCRGDRRWDDAEWHLIGNQWTQTGECLTVTRLLFVDRIRSQRMK